MNIWGVMPNIAANEAAGVKPANKSASNSLHHYNGQSFAESMSNVARSANIEITSGNQAASLQFSRRKEAIDELFNFQEAEEEIAENYILKITKLLQKLKK